jgi:hypothetical protein
MAQVVEHLHSKHEALSSNPLPPKEENRVQISINYSALGLAV